jgi:hypothetical protein
VLRDVCLVYVPDGADSLLSILKEQFSLTAKENAEDPYEFRSVPFVVPEKSCECGTFELTGITLVGLWKRFYRHWHATSKRTTRSYPPS